MNINSVVNQNMLSRSVTQKHMKNNAEGKSAVFDDKLFNLRKDMAVNRLRIKPDDLRAEKESKDDTKDVTCSSKLFSVFDENLSAEDALAKLDLNLSQIGEYSLDSDLNPKEVLEHLGAQYSLYKRHIAATGDGDRMKQLDKLMEKHIKKYAESFSEVVGGFYDQNGMEGEQKKIYNSVLDSVKGLTKVFDDYISNSPSRFNRLKEDALLNQESLTNELRRAVRKSGIVAEGVGAEKYNSSSLQRLEKIAVFAERLLPLGDVEIKNEEELGIQLGKGILKALDFLETYLHTKPGEKSPYEEQRIAFMVAVHKKLDLHMDKVDLLLEKEAENYREDNPDKTDNPYKPLDRAAVLSVVERMEKVYGKTGSIELSIEAGEAYGLQQYMSKVNAEGESERYKDSPFWEKVALETLKLKDSASYKYLWISKLLEGGSNPWLNAIA